MSDKFEFFFYAITTAVVMAGILCYGFLLYLLWKLVNWIVNLNIMVGY